MRLYDPNAFEVLGMVRSLFKQTGRAAEWPAVEARMKESDFAHLCAVAKEVSFGTIEVVTDEDEQEE